MRLMIKSINQSIKPAGAPVATEEWRITTGKAARWKAKAAEAKQKRTVTPRNKTPNMFVCLFVYSLSACNLKVMALVQKY
jgi:hypothetical protein